MPKTKKHNYKTRIVPYARGFKPPTSRKSQDAITYPVLPLSCLPPHLKPSETTFSSIPTPTSVDDWLAQYKEGGQTYKQFLRECPWLSRRRWKQIKCEFNPDGKTIAEKYPNGVIYLLSLGTFDSESGIAPNFSSLVEYLEIFYDLPVKILDGLKLEYKGKEVYITKVPDSNPSDAIETKEFLKSVKPHRKSSRQKTQPRTHHLESRYNAKTGHMQLRVNSILTTLKRYIPQNAFMVMALTMHDLFEDPSDLFVAGMAAGNHRVGVFSFSRYDPTCTFSTEFWYKISHCETTDVDENRSLVLQRSCKLLVHEVAHLLGVDHCIWYDCCMNGSGHLSEDFRQPMFLCPVDLNKLETLCGFDVVDRYRNMYKFFEKHKLEEEKQWIERRLKEIVIKID